MIAGLALGLSACGPQTSEDASAVDEAEQSVEVPGPTACHMDGCPAGMCAYKTAPSTSCSGGYIYYCTAIAPGVRCI
ncbi:hypothetical protein [Myxococcus sp. Y35]|uniref:hypothetical protein n=1 Tax=Pseudomyxococcus flavus TaxID=3115648 RepID=UPI003CE7008A